MPDLSFKCIWWVLVLLLTGHFSIDAGMYPTLHEGLEEFCDACSLVTMCSLFFFRF